jgi:hypothetical protein
LKAASFSLPWLRLKTFNLLSKRSELLSHKAVSFHH